MGKGLSEHSQPKDHLLRSPKSHISHLFLTTHLLLSSPSLNLLKSLLNLLFNLDSSLFLFTSCGLGLKKKKKKRQMPHLSLFLISRAKYPLVKTPIVSCNLFILPFLIGPSPSKIRSFSSQAESLKSKPPLPVSKCQV